jgi:hypothetical protein
VAVRYCFADEAGNLDFRPPGTGASRYFIITTVTVDDCAVGHALVDLRRQLAMEGAEVSQPFHAAEDVQVVRDRVFSCLAPFSFRVDATVLDKAKAQLQTRQHDWYFYKLAYFYHLKYVAPRVFKQGDDVLVVNASLGTKKDRTAFSEAVADVVTQTCRGLNYRSAFWTSASDPCLWVVDYCSWAIQRKWERGDHRSYDLIRDRIASEFDIWAVGQRRYY